MLVFCEWWMFVAKEKIMNTKSGPVHLFTHEQKIDFGRHMLKTTLNARKRSTVKFCDDVSFRQGDIAEHIYNFNIPPEIRERLAALVP